jgi:WD40 repeat protein
MKVTAKTHSGFVSSFGWSPDDQTLTVLTEDTLLNLNANTLNVNHALSTTFAAQVWALAPDGSQVVGSDKDQNVQVRDALNGHPLAKLNTKGQALGATYTPDSRTIATFSGDQIQVQLWDTPSGKAGAVLEGFQTAAPVFSAVFAPGGKTMAWVSRGTVQFMDVTSGKLGARLEFEDFVGHAQFSPDGSSLITVSAKQVNGNVGGVIDVWDADSGHKLQELVSTDLFTTFDVSPRGNVLAASTGPGLCFWSWRDNSAITSLGDICAAQRAGAGATPTASANQNGIRALSFSPDGTRLVTANESGTLELWQVRR